MEVVGKDIIDFVYFFVFVIGLKTIVGVPALNRLWRKDLREVDRQVDAFEHRLVLEAKMLKAQKDHDDFISEGTARMRRG